MNVDRINAAIRKQVGALHQRRHPSKGVVVEFEGFQEAVDRRSKILRKLTRHKNEMPDIIKYHNRIVRNRYRWQGIRDSVINRGAPLVGLAIRWKDDRPVGIEIADSLGAIHYSIDDAQAGLQQLWETTVDGFVVFHNLKLMTENLAPVGIKIPEFRRSIDTAQIGQLMQPRGTPDSPSSGDVGRMVDLDRGTFDHQSEFLRAVGFALASKEDIFG